MTEKRVSIPDLVMKCDRKKGTINKKKEKPRCSHKKMTEKRVCPYMGMYKYYTL